MTENQLEKGPDGQAWVWVIIDRPGQGEQLLALSDEREGSFVPAFRTKEDGLIGLGRLSVNLEKQQREVQAMDASEVLRLAARAGDKVLIIDGQGRVAGELELPES